MSEQHNDQEAQEMIAYLGAGSAVPLDLSVLAAAYRKDMYEDIVVQASEVWMRVDQLDLQELDRFSAIASLAEDQDGYNFLVSVAAHLPEGWHKNALLELADFGHKDPIPLEDCSEAEYEAWFHRAESLSDRLVEDIPAPAPAAGPKM